MDNSRPVQKHVQEPRSNKRLWRKPWRRSKTGLKGHRAPHSGNTQNGSLDQATSSSCHDGTAWHSHQLELSHEFPSLSSAVKAAYTLGVAIVSIHAAEIFEQPNLKASSSTSLYTFALPPRRSETRLKTLEEEAVSAALAAAAATAAAAAERARIAAQAALAIQAEQELEAATAMEEARIARELIAQQEKEDRKQSHQSELGSLLLPKRRRVPKNRAPRSGSVSQPQQQLSEHSISKKDPTAPIHSRPPPPMVSPRFAAKLVELVSTAGPVQMPQLTASKSIQPKRASVTRNNTKGAHPLSPPTTNPVIGSQPLSNRLPASTPTSSRSHRPNLTHTVTPQPPASAYHAPTLSAPNMQSNTFPQPHQYDLPGGHQVASHTPNQQSVPTILSHPPPPTAQSPPPPTHAPQQTNSLQQPTTSPLQSPLVQQSQPPVQQPQQAPQTAPLPASQPSPQPASQPTPQSAPQPVPQFAQESAPQSAQESAPQPVPQSAPQVNRPAKSSVFHAQTPSNPMPTYERPTNQTEHSEQHPYGMVANNSERPSYQQPSATSSAQPQTQHQATRPPPTSIPNNNYQPPASHLYGTLPRKNQTLTNALAQNVNLSPDLTSSTQPMPHITLAMLPNTASNPNQWAQRQLPEASLPSKPRNPNQRPSSATRPSVGALLRSGIRSLNRNSVSAVALDRPKQTDTSVAWNTTKIAAPADDSATAITDTILPPCDLSENDSSILYQNSAIMSWPPSWQNPATFNDTKPNLDFEQKQGINAWQQESYNFPLDVGAAMARGRVSQTILEVNHSSSLGSIPQPYMPIDTTASQRPETWWQKAPASSSGHWDKTASPASPLNRPLSQSPRQLPSNSPSSMPNWIPSIQQSQMPWQNQSVFEGRDRKRPDVFSGTTAHNTVKTSIQDSQYQQNIFQPYDNSTYQQQLLPSQQHYPETVLEEASVGGDDIQ